MQATRTPESRASGRQPPQHQHAQLPPAPSPAAPGTHLLSMRSDEEFLSRFGDAIDDRIAEILDELLEDGRGRLAAGWPQCGQRLARSRPYRRQKKVTGSDQAVGIWPGLRCAGPPACGSRTGRWSARSTAARSERTRRRRQTGPHRAARGRTGTAPRRKGSSAMVEVRVWARAAMLQFGSLL
jgi:hypothetical protein